MSQPHNISIGPGWSIGSGWRLGSSGSAPVVSGSVVFNGGNYLTVPNNTAFDQNSGSWTVEAFVYPTDSGQRYVYMQNTSGFIGLVYDGDSDSFGVDQQGIGFAISSASNFPINNWYHAAMSYNSSTSILTLYVNGVSQGSWSSGGLTASAAVTNIGCYVAGIQPYKGNISNMRVVKGVAVYTGNFTVPTAPLTATQSSGTNISAITAGQTQLLLNTVAPNYFADSSSNAFTVTNNGSVTTSTTNPF
jgi:hypothetical protein